MILVTITNEDGIRTMSSVDMVDFINASREPGSKEVRHDNFVVTLKRRFPTTPFQTGVVNFSVNNGAVRERTVYFLQKREAELIAMVYSEALQEAVYDAWQAAEAKLAQLTPALPNFEDPIAAAEAWIAEKKQTIAAQLQLAKTEEVLLEAQVELTEAEPKVAFHDAVVADGQDMTLGDAAKVLGVGRNTFINWLRACNYIQPNRVPYQTAITNDYLASSFAPAFVTSFGKVMPPTTYVTGKGLAHFQKKIAKLKEAAA